MLETLNNAHDWSELTAGSLRKSLHSADAVAGLILLDLIEEAARLEQRIAALILALDAKD